MMGMPRSFKILLSQTTSHVATAVPLYSAPVVDNATIGYFLLLPVMAPLSREKTNMDVDRQSDLYPAQLASVYPTSRMGVVDL